MGKELIQYLPVIILVLLAIFVIRYVSSNNEIRGVKILPYYLMICIMPIYYILDRTIFINMFPSAPILEATPTFASFSSNNLRAIVYTVITILIFILGIIFSRKLPKKKDKIIYVLSIFLFNVVLAFCILQFSMTAYNLYPA